VTAGRAAFRSLTWTPRELRTQARYDRCPGHIPSDVYTEARPWGEQYVQMPLCRRCGVPIPPRGSPRAMTLTAWRHASREA